MRVAVIIAAGGRGARMPGPQPKQLLRLGGMPILQRSIEAFVACDLVTSLVVALPEDLVSNPPDYVRAARKPIRIVAGGARRQDSVALAFAAVDPSTDLVLVHDAARPLVSDAVIRRTIAAAAEHGAAIPVLPAQDTVKRIDPVGAVITDTLRREEIVLAQTPQAFRIAVLREALAAGATGTDEASLAEAAGHRVRVVEGDRRNFKITTHHDLEMASHLLSARAALPAIRIGHGYDLHRLVVGRRLVLGGVTIPFDRGLLGHSDADVVCHAVTDAILGAAALGDIGRHFPDTEPAWKDADSVALLGRAATAVGEAGWRVANVDVTVIAQHPKLAPYVDAMRARLAGVLACDLSCVSVKGKTNEGVDSMGAGESIAAHAVVLVTASEVET